MVTAPFQCCSGLAPFAFIQHKHTFCSLRGPSVAVSQAEPWTHKVGAVLGHQGIVGGKPPGRCRRRWLYRVYHAAAPVPNADLPPSVLPGVGCRGKRPCPKNEMLAAAQQVPKGAPVAAVWPLRQAAPQLQPQHPFVPPLKPRRHPDSPAQQRQYGRRQEGRTGAPALQHHDCSSHQGAQGAQRQQRSCHLQAAGCGTVGGGEGPGLATSRRQPTLPRVVWHRNPSPHGFAGFRQTRSGWQCRRGRLWAERSSCRPAPAPPPPSPHTRLSLPAEKTYGNKLKDGIVSWHKQASTAQSDRAPAGLVRSTPLA